MRGADGIDILNNRLCWRLSSWFENFAFRRCHFFCMHLTVCKCFFSSTLLRKDAVNAALYVPSYSMYSFYPVLRKDYYAIVMVVCISRRRIIVQHLVTKNFQSSLVMDELFAPMVHTHSKKNRRRNKWKIVCIQVS